jgi:hypothetical protein
MEISGDTLGKLPLNVHGNIWTYLFSLVNLCKFYRYLLGNGHLPLIYPLYKSAGFPVYQRVGLLGNIDGHIW